MSPSTNIKFTGSDALIVAFLSCLWLGMIYLINPVGDFPIDDDWGYGLPAMAMANDGGLLFTDRQAVPLFTHVLWGSAFCWLFGSSFTVLRFSSLTAGWIGLIAVYWLLRRFTGKRSLALIGTLALVANPVFVNLSFTYMTDVPFLTLCVVSILLLITGLDKDKHWYCAIGLSLACFATLTRQLGLAIPLSFCIAWLIKNGYRHRWWLEAVLPTLLIGISLVAYTKLVESTIGLPAVYHTKGASMFNLLGHVAQLRLGALTYPAKRSFITFMYLGLFTLPLSVLLVPRLWQTMTPLARRRIGIGSAIFVVGATTACVATGLTMPMIGNNLVDFGLGLRSLAGEAPKAPAQVWIAVTLVSAIGCVLFVGLLIASAWSALLGHTHHAGLHAWHFVMLVLFCVMAIGPPSWMYTAFFDRYLLLLLPFCLALLLGASNNQHAPPPKWAMGLSVVLLAACFWFSIGATHDYLNWNRMRWQSGRYLIEEVGLPVEDVNGGFEFNQYFPNKANLRPGGVDGVVRKPDSPYVIAFEPLQGHDVIERLDCDPWLPWSVRYVWVLRSTAASMPTHNLSPARPSSHHTPPAYPQATQQVSLSIAGQTR